MGRANTDRLLYLCGWDSVDRDLLDDAIDWCGGWELITNGTRVLVKPNLTFPFHRPGVTTPPETIRALTEILLERGARVTICEAAPSLEVYSTMAAFAEHGILSLRDEFGIDVLDLCEEPVVYKNFGSARAGQNVPVTRVLEDADILVSMPVVKVHAMTTVSLSLKNQWGMIPSKKRFLFHPAINDILAGLNAMLPQTLVVCDGRTVLDSNGPMFGTARPGGFLAVGTEPGAFDFAMCILMGFDPTRIDHIRACIEAGIAPSSLDEIKVSADPIAFRPFQFTLRRSLQNYIALAGFKHSLICRLLYDSALGLLLHKLLYAIKGNPLQEAMAARGTSALDAEAVSELRRVT